MPTVRRPMSYAGVFKAVCAQFGLSHSTLKNGPGVGHSQSLFQVSYHSSWGVLSMYGWGHAEFLSSCFASPLHPLLTPLKSHTHTCPSEFALVCVKALRFFSLGKDCPLLVYHQSWSKAPLDLESWRLRTLKMIFFFKESNYFRKFNRMQKFEKYNYHQNKKEL